MGFSLIGTLIGIVILLPSLLFYILFPPKNAPANSSGAEPGMIYTIFERIGQMGCLTILVLSKDNFQGRHVDIWAVMMLFCMVVYYGFWIRYIAKGQDSKWLLKPLLFIPIPLAIFPVCAFGFTALWGKSIWLGIAVVILAIGHIKTTWQSYKYAIEE
jgi:hypothetical protein